jgi:hypothetical protein
MSKRGFFRVFPAVVLVMFVLPATAFGQATRTWVSGVGDDANPCSRTAPCKTFAGAISKTAAGGIIDAMDDGGFGALTITKAITVDGGHHTASLLASGGINAMNIAAGVNDKVTLRNLDFAGNGTTLGLNGIRITQAKTVLIENSQIASFSRNGVSFEPNNPNARLIIQDTTINNNGGNGVLGAPSAAAGGTGAKITLSNDEITDNACGATASSAGTDSIFTVNCGARAAATGTGSRIAINSYNTLFSDNTFVGLLAKGSQATQRFGYCEISANGTGIQAIDAGADTQNYTGTNLIGNNGTNGVPTSNLPPV